VRVVAFARREEFEAFVPRGAAGLFVLRDEPTVLLPPGLGARERAVVAHELAHHLLALRYQRLPPWFSEGTASYAETVGTGEAGEAPTAGGVATDRARALFPYPGGAARVLLARRHLEPLEYSIAWALVHFLRNAQADRLRELEARFERADDPDAAFREVFPEWNPGTPDGARALDRALERYLTVGRYTYGVLRLDREHPEPLVRALSPSEVHTLRLVLPRSTPDAIADGAEIAEALAEDPGHVAALMRRAATRRDQARALAERATAAHPEDVWAWLLLKDATQGAEREAALRRALEVAPDHPAPLNSLAWFLAESGRAEEALPLAQRAARLAPWNGPLLDTLAAALDGTGRCGEALSVQRRAWDLLPHEAPTALRAALRARLADLERRCGSP
jgi:tetratricopeptide (TPR) repeat protein